MLDEPTTGLDPTRTHQIHELVRKTQQQFELTAVMVSHDVPAVFEFSDRIAFMHQGKIALNGTVAEVMASKHENFTMFLQGRASGIDEPPTAAAAR
jgi:phospholipid/cholesterol/gamma-HCH transport system ATP-binding protein